MAATLLIQNRNSNAYIPESLKRVQQRRARTKYSFESIDTDFTPTNFIA